MTLKLDSKYSFPDICRLIWSVIITLIFFRPARIIRQPTRIRGFKNMEIGVGFTTGQYCRIEAANKVDIDEKSLVIGDNVQINDACHIAAISSVVIGNNVLIASQVYISDHDHGSINYEELLKHPSDRELVFSSVKIEDDVWIGEKVVILKGVTIGRGTVIGAGALVTKNIPAYSVAVGTPAKVIKSFN